MTIDSLTPSVKPPSYTDPVREGEATSSQSFYRSMLQDPVITSGGQQEKEGRKEILNLPRHLMSRKRDKVFQQIVQFPLHKVRTAWSLL